MASQRIQRNFQIAAASAEKSSMGYPLGACAVSGGKVLSVGYNTDRGSIRLPSMSSRSLGVEPSLKSASGTFLCSSTHAEVSAILRLFSSPKHRQFRQRQKRQQSHSQKRRGHLQCFERGSYERTGGPPKWYQKSGLQAGY